METKDWIRVVTSGGLGLVTMSIGWTICNSTSGSLIGYFTSFLFGSGIMAFFWGIFKGNNWP